MLFHVKEDGHNMIRRERKERERVGGGGDYRSLSNVGVNGF